MTYSLAVLTYLFVVMLGIRFLQRLKEWDDEMHALTDRGILHRIRKRKFGVRRKRHSPKTATHLLSPTH